MIKLNRGQIGKKAGIDVTVRANLPVSPTWEMVRKSKDGVISILEYIDWYKARLDIKRDEVYAWAKTFTEDITFLCYCRDDDFCHTYLLIDWLVSNFPMEFCSSYEVFEIKGEM